MQYPLIPDIRKTESKITIHEKIYRYSVHFAKNQSGIVIESIRDGELKIRAPLGTDSETIDTEIRTFIKKIEHKNEANQQAKPDIIIAGTINIRGFDIPYTTKFNRRRKGPYIFMLPDGRVEVEIPHPVSHQEISALLLNEKEWLYREYYRSRPECPPEVETQTIHIQGREIPYLIRRNPRAKKVTLKILGTGAVEVSAPINAASDSIMAFVEKNTAWIAPRIDLIPEEKIIPPTDAKTNTLGEVDENGEIMYEGHTIPYKIQRSIRAKRVTIKINRHGEVIIVAPKKTQISEIQYLAQQKADWIFKHTIQSTRPIPPQREYRDGEIFPFLGETITIKILKGDRPDCQRKDGELVIIVPGNFNTFNEKSLVKQIISTYFSEVLYQFSMPYFTSYAQKLQVRVPPVKIRDQKTKWGTCTPHSIILNLRLCMAPPVIIEYVIVHELAHKKNPDHSPRFWNTVESLMPDYQEKRDFLKKNGYSWVL